MKSLDKLLSQRLVCDVHATWGLADGCLSQTMDQFRDFEKFIDKIDKYGMQSGIVKVVPPPEWYVGHVSLSLNGRLLIAIHNRRESLPDLSELVKTIKIKNPIMQEFMGTHGTYTQANIEKQRSYNLPEWKSLTEEPSHQPPARRGERRRNQEKVVRGGGTTRGRASAPKPAEKPEPVAGARRRGRPRKKPLPTEDADEDSEKGTQVPPTPTSPSRKAVESVESSTPTKPKPKPRGRGRPPKNGDQAKSVTSRRMNNITEKNDIIDEAAFEGFDYKMDQQDLDEFTAERCSELETAYWKSVTFAQPMYAADMPGSLFEDSTTSWNVAKLPNLLDILGTKVPGVNTAYLYLGMWKATFAWHLEDVDLYSINYIHFGAPKQWYSISQEDARKFERAMRTIWPNDSKNCDQFLRHKTYLISPELLQKQFGIKVNKLVHYEGEFVITYPYGYHSGYNIGYNCAESVNFANEGWLEYGRIARKCDCEADSVWVDVADVERKLRGEPTPEYYEETDDDDDDDLEPDHDLPSPPASVAEKPKAQSRKRKRDIKDKDAGKKKKRIRIRIKGPTREPCILCPNEASHEPLLPTDNGRMAHRSCALFTPETWIIEEDGVEKVLGVAGIDRARLELKCNFCRSKRGACFQCAAKKCTRAFHATCALAAGVQIDSGMVPTFGEDGTEYFEEGFDFRCRFHRPKRAKNVDADSLEGSKLVNNYAKTLKQGDVIQMQYLQGDIFAGSVVENRPEELSLLVDILPEGYVLQMNVFGCQLTATSDRVEIEWKWLTVLDPMDSQRPKPSSAAIPMPEGMNKKSVSIENRQDGVPNMEEPFHDNPDNKWAEFVTLEIPPSGYARGVIKNNEQVKIDMAKPDHLYYYLPGISTEAKSKWTDDYRGKTHVVKADFMDRVKPATAYRPPAPSYGNVYNTQVANPRPQQYSAERPYVYKPKTPAVPLDNRWSVDQQALASQRDFMAEADRRASYSTLPGPYGTLPPLRQQVSEPNGQSAGQLRPFPGDQYYSSRVLPAAVPGEYSSFSEQVRRNSGLSERRPSFGMQSHTRQPSSGTPGSNSAAQLMRRESGSLSTPQGHSQASPATGMYNKPINDFSPHGEFIKQLEQKNSRLATGFNSHSQSQSQTKEEPSVTKTLPQLPLPAPSASPADAFRRTTAEWTPPSRLYTSSSNPTLPSYLGGRFSPLPPQPQSNSPAYPIPRQQPTYQSPEDFRSQLGQQSVASRYGTYERMLKNMANSRHDSITPSRPQNQAASPPYQSTTTAGGATNGFRISQQTERRTSYQDNKNTQPPGQQHQYSGFGMGSGMRGGEPYQSPKAPEYSPLSATDSPAHANTVTWGGPPPPQLPPLNGMNQVSGQNQAYQHPPQNASQPQYHRRESGTQQQQPPPMQQSPSNPSGQNMGDPLMRSSQQLQRETHMDRLQHQMQGYLQNLPSQQQPGQQPQQQYTQSQSRSQSQQSPYQHHQRQPEPPRSHQVQPQQQQQQQQQQQNPMIDPSLQQQQPQQKQGQGQGEGWRYNA